MKNTSAATLILYVALSSLVHKIVIIVRAEYSCNCSETNSPVCGSDGVTYGNDCLRQCKGGVYKVSDTACNQGCPCPFNYDPVCGTDGITYGNACQWQCKNTTSNFAYKGECKSSKIE